MDIVSTDEVVDPENEMIYLSNPEAGTISTVNSNLQKTVAAVTFVHREIKTLVID